MQISSRSYLSICSCSTRAMMMMMMINKNPQSEMAKFALKTLLLWTPKRAFSASPSTASSSFTVGYLVDSCGLSSKSALSISQKVQLNKESIHKTESVFNLLKSHGFDDTHIAKLIEKLPRILLIKAGNTLKPKLEFLVQNGIAGRLLQEVIVKNPLILYRNLTSHIKPSLEFLWEVLKTEKRVVSAVKKGAIWPFQCNIKDNMQPNIDFLTKEGVEADRIANFIATRPGFMLQKLDSVARSVKLVKELGIEPSASIFLPAIFVRSCMKDSVWDKKVQVFQSWGLSEEEITEAFRRYPFCFACSVENLRNTMDFYVNTMKLVPEAITCQPFLLALSLDKRIRPRYSVWTVLMEKNLLEEKANPTLPLIFTEEKFLKKCVTKHLEVVPSLMEIYNTAKKGTISSSQVA